MIKTVYFIGLICFVGSFFAPATAQQMTSEYGEKVERWMAPGDTHFELALGPVLRVLDSREAARSPDVDADGVKTEQAQFLWRAFYALPASCGWFAIWASVIFLLWVGSRPAVSKATRVGLQVSGGMLLFAALPLTRDFYGAATIYPGYFHLGPGAYMIVGAYLFVGSSLLSTGVRAVRSA